MFSRRLVPAAAIFSASVLAAGCGGDKNEHTPNVSTTPTTVSAAVSKKSKATISDRGANVYGAFNNYISKPGALDTKAGQATAASAVLYMVKELGPMKAAALTDPALQQIAVRIDNLIPHLGSLVVRLRQDRAKAKDVSAASDALDALLSTARSNGASIDRTRAPNIK